MTKPVQGDPTTKSQIDQLIDNDEYLKSQVDTIKSDQVVNGSFETPGSGTPTGWVFTAHGTGSGAIDTSDANHGDQSFKFTHSGSASPNGGGYLESENYFEVSPNLIYGLSWEQKSSGSDVRNLVEIGWYTSALVSISTSTLYDSSAPPTSWTLQSAVVTPPSTARFAKIKITGGHPNTTPPGSRTIHFDNVRITSSTFQKSTSFEVAGTYAWVAPTGVTIARVTCIGGGGGGGGGNSDGGGGGGGGEFAQKLVSVTPASSYAVVVGAGGAGGATGLNGVAGGNSTFATTTVIATGGGFGEDGTGSPGSGGAGGTGGTGDLKIDGRAGSAGNTSTGGAGGHCQRGGAGGLAAGTAGTAPGGGGGGGNDSGSTAGGNGAAGRVTIEY